MPLDWREEYLSSIQEVERNTPVNRQLVDACSQLADRVAALEAEKAVLLQKVEQPSSSTAAATATTTAAAAATTANPGDSAGLAQVKFELAEALRSRGQLQIRVRAADDELQKLRARARQDTKRISELTVERNSLASKLRDRNSELVEKNKLVKEVQDENLTLDLQLNMVEQRASKVTAENKELIDRWMKRMGEEADAMNLANEPQIGNPRSPR